MLVTTFFGVSGAECLLPSSWSYYHLRASRRHAGRHNTVLDDAQLTRGSRNARSAARVVRAAQPIQWHHAVRGAQLSVGLVLRDNLFKVVSVGLAQQAGFSRALGKRRVLLVQRARLLTALQLLAFRAAQGHFLQIQVLASVHCAHRDSFPTGLDRAGATLPIPALSPTQCKETFNNFPVLQAHFKAALGKRAVHSAPREPRAQALLHYAQAALPDDSRALRAQGLANVADRASSPL